MKKRLGFYKNLILAVASALTLVAVSFAWFSNTTTNMIPSISGEVVSPTYASVLYYVDNGVGNYSPLLGDIELNNWTAGSYKKYRMIMTTATTEKLKLGMSIKDLPTNMNANLKNSVQVKYSIYKGEKKQRNDKTVYFVDKQKIFESNYMSLSTLSNGVICSGRSLASYQSTKNDIFVIYYEIGLKPDSPSTISGLSSSLGTFKISVQPIV